MVNKKGSILDWFLIIPFILLISISTMIAYIVINTADSVDVFSDNEDAQNGITQSKNAILGFDTLILFILTGLSLFVIVGSALVSQHPAFFFFSVFFLFIAIVVAASVSNTFWLFTQDSVVASASSSYPKTVYLMNHLPLYILFMGFTALIAAYVGRKYGL